MVSTWIESTKEDQGCYEEEGNVKLPLLISCRENPMRCGESAVYSRTDKKCRRWMCLVQKDPRLNQGFKDQKKKILSL